MTTTRTHESPQHESPAIGPETWAQFSLRDVVAIVAGIIAIAGVYFSVKSDVGLLSMRVTAIEGTALANKNENSGALRDLNDNIKELAKVVYELKGAVDKLSPARQP